MLTTRLNTRLVWMRLLAKIRRSELIITYLSSIWLWFMMVKSRPQPAWRNHIWKAGSWVEYTGGVRLLFQLHSNADWWLLIWQNGRKVEQCNGVKTALAISESERRFIRSISALHSGDECRVKRNPKVSDAVSRRDQIAGVAAKKTVKASSYSWSKELIIHGISTAFAQPVSPLACYLADLHNSATG